mgnify:CR=1 FL=1
MPLQAERGGGDTCRAFVQGVDGHTHKSTYAAAGGRTKAIDRCDASFLEDTLGGSEHACMPLLETASRAAQARATSVGREAAPLHVRGAPPLLAHTIGLPAHLTAEKVVLVPWPTERSASQAHPTPRVLKFLPSSCGSDGAVQRAAPSRGRSPHAALLLPPAALLLLPLLCFACPYPAPATRTHTGAPSPWRPLGSTCSRLPAASPARSWLWTASQPRHACGPRTPPAPGSRAWRCGRAAGGPASLRAPARGAGRGGGRCGEAGGVEGCGRAVQDAGQRGRAAGGPDSFRGCCAAGTRARVPATSRAAAQRPAHLLRRHQLGLHLGTVPCTALGSQGGHRRQLQLACGQGGTEVERGRQQRVSTTCGTPAKHAQRRCYAP